MIVPVPGELHIAQSEGFHATGLVGGPFTPASATYTLSNLGTEPLNWTATKNQTWLALSTTGGTLQGGASVEVSVSLNGGADTLAAGMHNDTVTLTNSTNGNGNSTRAVSLHVVPSGGILVTPGSALASSGLVRRTVLAWHAPIHADQYRRRGHRAWTASKTQNWVSLSGSGGNLAAGGSATLTVSISNAANSLAAGNHTDTVTITNSTNGVGTTMRPVSLSVLTPGVLSVTPSGGLTSSGLAGGPFSPSSVVYTLANTGDTTISWTATKSQSWMTLSNTFGTLPPGASTPVTMAVGSAANALTAGNHSGSVSFANVTNGNGNTTRALR